MCVFIINRCYLPGAAACGAAASAGAGAFSLAGAIPERALEPPSIGFCSTMVGAVSGAAAVLSGWLTGEAAAAPDGRTGSSP